MTFWRTLLPAAVTVVEATDEMWSEPVTPCERASIERAVSCRRREYQAGRAAARIALRDLGVKQFDLLPGLHREPLWPPGIVGSLTHAGGHCAAAVARRTDVLAVGIDVEPATPLASTLVGRVCDTVEQNRLGVLEGYAAGVCAKLIFSAKEAFYKAYFPAVGRLLDFGDVRVHLQPERGMFSAELCAPAPALFACRSVAGCFAVRDGLIFTAVCIRSQSAV